MSILENNYRRKLLPSAISGFPKLLIVGGQPRSGTSMLWALLNSHPDIQLTFELRNFSRLGEDYSDYVKRLRKSWWKWNYLGQKQHIGLLTIKLQNLIFLSRYLLKMVAYRGQQIDINTVRNVLISIFPGKKIVGDKFPPYIRKIDAFADLDNLYRVVIYRDLRDVVQSTLIQTRTNWKRREFSQFLNTPQKIAAKWVKSIEKMERNADRLHIIRYENLVSTPETVIKDLAGYLDLDPVGFDNTLLRTTSIGKFRKTLSDHQIAEIIQTGGPTMKRLGYI